MDFAKLVRGIVILGLSVLLASCHGSSKESVGKIEEPDKAPKKIYPFDTSRGCYNDGIVNGTPVIKTNPLNSHVVMVLSRFQKGSGQEAEILSTMCTGTLIGPHTVLTAAHCFPKNLISTQIIASINLFCSSGFNKELVFPVLKIDIHPDYRFKDSPSISSPDNDVATVQFEGLLPAEYTPLPVRKIDVLQEMGNQSARMVMVGYGRTRTEDESLPELRFVSKTWDTLLLTKDSQNLIDRLSLVGINQSDARGGCSGDSGGPLLIADSDGFRILGVASYIESQSEDKLCEQGQIYYSYIPAYWDWISRQIK